eukprot:COSAG01_NODE_46135_length_402_cov_16.231023_2_plen_38_part_01
MRAVQLVSPGKRFMSTSLMHVSPIQNFSHGEVYEPCVS